MKSFHLSSLPTGLSRFLGYRPPTNPPKKNLPTWRNCFWTFLAAWLGIAVLEIIGTYSPQLQAYHSPIVVASFGASAVLLYGSIDVPLAQPRNAFFGHVIGALVGVIISKLFTQLPGIVWASKEQQEIVQWVAGATAVGITIVLMQLTITVHPPGGATALIATVDQKVIDMSWYYIGVIAMSAAVQIVIACLINNLDRKYPNYWWRPNSTTIPAPCLKNIIPAPSHHSSSTATTVDQDIIIDMNNDDDDDDNEKNKNTNQHKSQNSQDLSISTAVPSSSSSSSSFSSASRPKIILDPSKPLQLPTDLLDNQDILLLESIYKKLSNSK
ncbi:HPP family-domain-containing protein [Cunninghamella echinulata]|nr:HPP family-domain-containing protein [Cunninghamella echinulata]